jgi:hypothetical protein
MEPEVMDDTQISVIRPKTKPGSPLDVEGMDLGITAAEIVQFIQEGRRVYEPAAQADSSIQQTTEESDN